MGNHHLNLRSLRSEFYSKASPGIIDAMYKNKMFRFLFHALHKLYKIILVSMGAVRTQGDDFGFEIKKIAIKLDFFRFWILIN